MIDLSDPISRQQTITALRALSDDDGYINVPHEVVTDVVRGLPPVKVKQGRTTQPERGESDKLTSKMGGTWVNVTCPNCGCEIHVESAQPERTCVNCGRTANNGGWYADGGTRCPIEEHYALPKDGYCHLWEKRNVTDDDYPERREK